MAFIIGSGGAQIQLPVLVSRRVQQLHAAVGVGCFRFLDPVSPLLDHIARFHRAGAGEVQGLDKRRDSLVAVILSHGYGYPAVVDNGSKVWRALCRRHDCDFPLVDDGPVVFQTLEVIDRNRPILENGQRRSAGDCEREFFAALNALVGEICRTAVPVYGVGALGAFHHRVQRGRGVVRKVLGFELPLKAAVPGQRQGGCVDGLYFVFALQLQLDGIGLMNNDPPLVGGPVQGQLGGGALRPGRVERTALSGLVGGGGGNVGFYKMGAVRSKRPAVGPDFAVGCHESCLCDLVAEGGGLLPLQRTQRNEAVGCDLAFLHNGGIARLPLQNFSAAVYQRQVLDYAAGRGGAGNLHIGNIFDGQALYGGGGGVVGNLNLYITLAHNGPALNDTTVFRLLHTAVDLVLSLKPHSIAQGQRMAVQDERGACIAGQSHFSILLPLNSLIPLYLNRQVGSYGHSAKYARISTVIISMGGKNAVGVHQVNIPRVLLVRHLLYAAAELPTPCLILFPGLHGDRGAVICLRDGDRAVLRQGRPRQETQAQGQGGQQAGYPSLHFHVPPCGGHWPSSFLLERRQGVPLALRPRHFIGSVYHVPAPSRKQSGTNCSFASRIVWRRRAECGMIVPINKRG